MINDGRLKVIVLKYANKKHVDFLSTTVCGYFCLLKYKGWKRKRARQEFSNGGTIQGKLSMPIYFGTYTQKSTSKLNFASSGNYFTSISECIYLFLVTH